MKIVAIAGSLRKASFNLALANAAAELAPDSVDVEVHTIHGIPLYDADIESASGIPEVAARLKERITAADGLLLVTPEYNQSLPGPFKNTIDWLSRPPKDIGRVFAGMPVGLIGATPGRGGTRNAQNAWLPVFRGLSLLPYLSGSLYVASAGGVFNEERELVDDTVKELLEKYMAGFSDFVQQHARKR
jgi:NAD(P)H-dependent FMN reductase